MKTMTVISLNIEGNKHFDRFIPFFQHQKPDVVCLQEVFAQDILYLEKTLRMKSIFAPMVSFIDRNQYGIEPRGSWGVSVFTNPNTVSLVNKSIRYYVGDKSRIPVFVDGQPNSSNRVFVWIEAEKEDSVYSIATTHFTWSAGGSITQQQIDDLAQLNLILNDYSRLILCGDFNMVRGGGLFEKIGQRFKDNIPQKVKTTLDHSLHYAGPLDLVVDGFFTTDQYQVDSIDIVDGLSDHKAIVAKVSQKQRKVITSCG